MNRIQIYYWHGDNLKSYQKQKLKNMGMYEWNGRYYIDLTPAEFVDKWQDNVLLLAPNDSHKEWLVGVTGHTNFNQR